MAPTGDIALLYYIQAVGPNGGALYVAFLSPSTGGGSADGGSAGGLTLKTIVLVTDSGPYVTKPVEANGDNEPNVIWSNTSQTFVVNYRSGDDVMTLNKFAVGGQAAGGVETVPTLRSDNAVGTNGSVGESGSLLGVSYMGAPNASAEAALTILDESGNLVGTPIVLGQGDSSRAWTSVSGTAQGFVCFYGQSGQQAAAEVFVSTSPDAGIVGASADAGIPTLPGFSLAGNAVDIRTIADDVGNGGRGGVGVALVFDTGSVGFAYVNADGAGHLGPYQVFAHGGSESSVSMTNFNGSFVVSAYTGATNSAQVIATGLCP